MFVPIGYCIILFLQTSVLFLGSSAYLLKALINFMSVLPIHMYVLARLKHNAFTWNLV